MNIKYIFLFLAFAFPIAFILAWTANMRRQYGLDRASRKAREERRRKHGKFAGLFEPINGPRADEEDIDILPS
jgi:hypothetical protein